MDLLLVISLELYSHSTPGLLSIHQFLRQTHIQLIETIFETTEPGGSGWTSFSGSNLTCSLNPCAHVLIIIITKKEGWLGVIKLILIVHPCCATAVFRVYNGFTDSSCAGNKYGGVLSKSGCGSIKLEILKVSVSTVLSFK